MWVSYHGEPDLMLPSHFILFLVDSTLFNTSFTDLHLPIRQLAAESEDEDRVRDCLQSKSSYWDPDQERGKSGSDREKDE